MSSTTSISDWLNLIAEQVLDGTVLSVDDAAKLREASTTIKSMAEEIEGLRSVIERLGSNETMTLPFMRRENSEGRELDARLDYARQALSQGSTISKAGDDHG